MKYKQGHFNKNDNHYQKLKGIKMNTIPEKFNALVGREGVITAEQADSSVLYDGEVTVKVSYSCINYKDALAVTGKGKILRSSPVVPGIDYAGEVISSQSDTFKQGDQVLLTGYGVGEGYSGGFAEYARAKAEWLLPIPSGMDAKQAMICGTAGLTAALCVQTLQNSNSLKSGDSVIVSGASGGVGSFAVVLLSRMGYSVTAISREEARDYLQSLGATDLITRESMSEKSRPLEKSRWAGAVDTVGDSVLARILAEMNYHSTVAACGLAGGFKLETTVMPFILRNVTLAGVDSVMAPIEKREQAWNLLSEHLTAKDYEYIGAKTIGLADVSAACEEIISGGYNGRIIVQL